jgi:DHA1 family inner membrane transport protein
LGFAGRLLGNALYRAPFVFLPTLATGLGVSRSAVGTVLSVREAVGLGAPVIGTVVDRGHERSAMVVGAALGALGALVAVTTGHLGAFAVGLVMMGLGKHLWDNGQNTWAGHEVPFTERGKVLGLIETSWAGAYLAIVPLMGLLIHVGDWRLPFVAVGGALGAVAIALPATTVMAASVRPVRTERRRLPRGGLPVYAAFFTLAFGHQLIITSIGSWLNDSYGLSSERLGVAALVIGVGELIGSGATIVLADRMGKRRAALGGTILLLVPMLAIGYAGSSVIVAVAIFSVFAGVFEFAFVAAIPLITEIDPEARATGIGLAVADITASRSIAIVVSVRLYQAEGIRTTSVVAACTVIVSIACFAFFVREPR